MLVFAARSFAANTITCNDNSSYQRECTITIDSTGTVCYPTGERIYHSYIADLTAGTITYRWDISMNNSPSGGQSQNLLSTTKTADDSAKITMPASFLCINVTACSSCAMTVVVMSVSGR